MPAPPYPIGHPLPSQLTAFTSADFETAEPLVADPAVYTSQERALHQQAAGTMEQFQDNSRDVYATVPQFAPPNLRRTPRVGPPDQPPPPQPPPTPQPPSPPVPPRDRARRAGGPAPRATPEPGAPPGAAPRPRRTARARAAAAGAAEPAAARPAAAALGCRQARRAVRRAWAACRWAARGGQGGDEDTEHKSTSTSKGRTTSGASNDQQAMPPVIGEVNRRA